MSEKKQPIDDYGFKNDQIVDCLEKIIDNVCSNNSFVSIFLD